MFLDLWKHREMIEELTRRDINQSYQGSFLGIIWSLIAPLSTLLIYTFVFSVVFQARWNVASDQPTPKGEFALILFSGLTAFNIFSIVINRSPGLILSVPNYVKKVIFPLEILSVVATGSAVITSLVNIMLILVGAALIYQGLSPTVWLLPLAYLPLILLTLGMSWFLSSLGVYIRDMGQAIGVIVQVLFFLTPIVYSSDTLPEDVRFLANANPFALIVDWFRSTLLWGTMPDWGAWCALTLICAVIAILGYAWFSLTKKGFADVL
jgi:lipopolysaccharide transport system permease protein